MPDQGAVEVTASYSVLRVLIAGLPAVHLDRTRLVGWYAWHERASGMGYITFYFRDDARPMETEWDDMDLWKDILAKLQEAI